MTTLTGTRQRTNIVLSVHFVVHSPEDKLNDALEDNTLFTPAMSTGSESATAVFEQQRAVYSNDSQQPC